MKTSRKNYLNTSVSGRSMVEMLGVLAIIGVLSIGALNGFRYAMDKAKANTILYDVSMAFADLQMREEVYVEENINLGFTPESQLTMYGYVTLDDYDYVVVEAVPEGVCEKLLSSKNTGNIGAVYKADLSTELTECDGDTTMAFKRSAGSGAVVNGQERECSPACSACESCVKGVCEDNCPTGQKCTNGTCQCETGTYNETAGMCCDEVTAGVCQTVTEATSGVCPSVTTAQDGTECTTTNNEAGTCLSGVCQVDYEGKDCTSNDHCGGNGNGTYFCAFDNPTDCGDDDKGAGKCALVSRYTYDETTDKNWRLSTSSNDMNWWNAQNWCYAQSGFRPATLADVECSIDTWDCSDSTIVYNEGSVFAQNGGSFTSTYAWLDDYGDSCYAYTVYLTSGYVYNLYHRSYNSGYALCVRR